MFDRLVLKDPGDPGYAGKPRRRRKSGDPAEVPESKPDTRGSNAGVTAGAVGTALTDLRPVGKVKMEGRVVVAETDGEYYDKGIRVVVQRTDGVKVVVSAEEE